MSEVAALILPPSFTDGTIGALLLGAFATAIIYGVMCQQFYTFAMRSLNREGRLIKYSVSILWLLDTTHLALTIHPVYYLVIRNFGNYPALAEVPWSIPVGVIVTSTGDLIIRSCFAQRVWILSDKNAILIGFMVIPVLLTWATSITFASQVLARPYFEEIRKLNWVFYFALSTSVVSDFYIAISLCFFLYRGRRHMHQKSYTVVNSLMAYTINTGLITSLVCLTCMITHAAMPGNFVYIGIFFVLNGLYNTSLLASLNARDVFRHREPVELTSPTAIDATTEVDRGLLTVTDYKVSGSPRVGANGEMILEPNRLGPWR